MLRVDVGVIGGTGVGERLAEIPGKVVHVPTAKGFVRGRLIEVDGKRIFALSRHSAGHKVPPHKVNYAAMALALRQLGARACLATAAVGSLRPAWDRGTLVACSDFLDVSGRFPTLYDTTVVHTDFSRPFDARELLVRASNMLDVKVQDRGVYVCGNGPRYETPQEIRVYGQMGGDLVGMTAASEAILMKEAGIPYGCLAIVTNLASGLSEAPLDHDDVSREMEKSGHIALRILMKAASIL